MDFRPVTQDVQFSQKYSFFLFIEYIWIVYLRFTGGGF